MVRGAIMTSPCPSRVRAIPSVINPPYRNGPRHKALVRQPELMKSSPKLHGTASIVGSAVCPEDSVLGRSRQHVRPSRKVQRPKL